MILVIFDVSTILVVKELGKMQWRTFRKKAQVSLTFNPVVVENHSSFTSANNAFNTKLY
jgi:hypothetical protein